ncbi:L-pipecolate oxidase [Pseudocercospora fuligena]|uniref:L-pipecolate oxidase n=1 Tax=Pseudocercospora fuligena TaxID=685502 RepID=A0A8H6RF24_9PEZI|nr:L-pipecolate oxidase [Pseudocercospora fuligena]
MSSQEESVLIIGAGVFGASTAFHLAKTYQDASKITVIDRTPAPPEPAASTDINKIIRADYSSAFYADLAYEAMEAWKTWPELKNYYHQTGWIMLDENSSDLSTRIRQVFRERGNDPTSDVPIEDLPKHWNGILKGTNTSGFKTAYFNPEAGWCDAAAATAGIINAVISKGVNYIVDDVSSLIHKDQRISAIRTESGKEYSASKIVFATGAWTSSLLSPLEDLLSIPFSERIERQCTAAGVAVVHYRMSESQMKELENMPVVVYGEKGEVIPPPGGNRLLKFTNANTFTNNITISSGHTISVPPEGIDQRIVPDILKSEMHSNMTSNVMTQFSSSEEPEYWRICWDSITPTQDWLLTKHPDPRLGNLFVAAGGSFHSYKFLPVIGKYMVRVLSGERNGSEKDRAWGWKGEDERKGGGGAHKSTLPKRDLSEIWNVGRGARL